MLWTAVKKFVVLAKICFLFFNLQSGSTSYDGKSNSQGGRQNWGWNNLF